MNTQPLDDRDEFPWLEEDPSEQYVEVAPGILQTKKDYDENMAFDEMRDNQN